MNKLSQVGCHVTNVGELLEQVGSYVDDSGVIRIPASKLPVLAGLFFLKLEETFLECEGKPIVIEIGDSSTANIAENAIVTIANFLKEQALKEFPVKV